MVTQLGNAESFSLLGKNGFMQQNKRVHCSRGTKIHAHGYAMSLQYFVVYDDDMNAVEICTGDPNEVDEYDLEKYYSPKIKVDECARSINDVFGIGVYYDESEEISDEIIEKSLKRAENIERLKREKEEREQREYEEARERLIKDFDYLERVQNRYDHKVTGRNIRTELKREFPQVKFSVKKSGYDCYNISWTDGPTTEQVEKIVNRYKTGCFDAYTDYHYSESSPFTDLFGGVDYIFTSREISETALKQTRERYKDLTADNMRTYNYDNGEFVHLAYDARTLDELISRIAWRLDFMPKIEKKETETVKADGVQIVDYSEKAFVITGDTREIKATLKALGGRFNPRLSCGAGWVFSKKKETEIREKLGI